MSSEGEETREQYDNRQSIFGIAVNFPRHSHQAKEARGLQ